MYQVDSSRNIDILLYADDNRDCIVKETECIKSVLQYQ